MASLSSSPLPAEDGREENVFRSIVDDSKNELDAMRAVMAVFSKHAGLKNVKQASAPMCGKVFKGGELCYSCVDCREDATCVVCEACFDPAEHEGHDYSYHIAGPGGMCDCGDGEAWKTPCKRHRKNAEPCGDLQQSVRDEATALFASIACILADAAKSCSAAFDLSRQEFQQDGEVSLVLNNDDVHTYQEVISAVGLLTGCSHSEALRLTTGVDKAGSSVVFKGSLEECKARARRIKDVGLLVSFETERHARLMVVARACAKYMASVDSFQLREIAGTALTTTGPLLRKRKRVESSQEEITCLKLLIQHDALLPKALRRTLNELYLRLLMGKDFRQVMAEDFVAMAPKRAEDYSRGIGTRKESLSHISVQLLTVPSVVQALAQKREALWLPLVAALHATQMEILLAPKALCAGLAARTAHCCHLP